MRSPIVLISLSMAILGVAAPGLALATPNFPEAIQNNLALTYTPLCIVCHDNPNGGSGTVTQAFGKAMVGDGLIPYDADSLKQALTKLQATPAAGCDGTIAVKLLKEGRSPNDGTYIDGSNKTPTTTEGCGVKLETPEYGCGAHITATSSASAWQSALAVAALLGIGLFRRRRG